MVVNGFNGFGDKIIQAYDKLEIQDIHRGSLNTCLGIIYGRDKLTGDHSSRVALTGKKIGEFIHHDPKILFYTGITHDLGKILTNPGSLKKNTNFGPKDMKKLENHVKDGYQLLKEIHPFSAEILLRHHQFQDNPYPKKLPDLPKQFSRETEVMINYFARILSLIDFYDAMTNRKNEKWGKPARLPTKKQGKKFILEKNLDQAYFINELYGAGIF